MDNKTQEILRCPICKGPLIKQWPLQLLCASKQCNKIFPVVDGVAILLNEKESIYTIKDIIQIKASNPRQVDKIARFLSHIFPHPTQNFCAKKNYSRFVKELLAISDTPKVLVLGGSVLGQGMKPLISHPSITLIESDIAFGPRTTLICDAHNIPFADGYFDGVVIQAVLEHVVDPNRCVREIHRVLKTGGVIYAETPFMQQAHGKPYDFNRFTTYGHRLLFRGFKEIESGAVAGPATALAWAYEYFLLAFFTSNFLRRCVRGLARMTSFYLKYIDCYLVHRPGAIDAAAGYYFMGSKSDTNLSDKELLRI